MQNTPAPANIRVANAISQYISEAFSPSGIMKEKTFNEVVDSAIEKMKQDVDNYFDNKGEVERVKAFNELRMRNLANIFKNQMKEIGKIR